MVMIFAPLKHRSGGGGLYLCGMANQVPMWSFKSDIAIKFLSKEHAKGVVRALNLKDVEIVETSDE
jgi:hypothetical protein